MVSMASTVVGVYDDYTQAEAAKVDLLRAGFGEEEVHISERGPSEEATTETMGTSKTGGRGIWDNLRALFGKEDGSYYEEGTYYEEAERRGGALVTVYAGQELVEKAAEILERHHPVDIDKRAQEWRSAGWEGPMAASRGKEQTIPVAEEELHVGKRVEQRGGVRIYKHVTEQPVEERVRLREERADVKRRPADRPADEAAFREETIEVTETVEEPVVEKRARVTEEVVIDKDVTEHEEKVGGTVRKTEVDVERSGERKRRKPRR